jgi:hypothetical protein
LAGEFSERLQRWISRSLEPFLQTLGEHFPKSRDDKVTVAFPKEDIRIL